MLANLHCLDLSGTRITDAGILQFPRFQYIERVDFTATQITDAAMPRIGEWTTLRHLRLMNLEFGPQLSDVGLLHISKLTNLESLDLTHTGVSDAGLKHLLGLKQLRSLNIECTDVTDEGLSTLGELDGLLDLRLTGTKATDKGVQRLQERLPNCRIDFVKNTLRCNFPF